jgi:hypothetical protein
MLVAVTYNLTGAGWSDCVIEAKGQRACLSASYLSDALGELLRATANIMNSVPDTIFP